MRKQFEGVLNVYRDNRCVDFLSGAVKLDDGTRFEYYRCPKQFEVLVTGYENCVRLSFVANEDGSNPRQVVAKGQPFHPA